MQFCDRPIAACCFQNQRRVRRPSSGCSDIFPAQAKQIACFGGDHTQFSSENSRPSLAERPREARIPPLHEFTIGGIENSQKNLESFRVTRHAVKIIQSDTVCQPDKSGNNHAFLTTSFW